MKLNLALLLSVLVLTGCSTTSHVLVGKTRPPTNAADVKVYLTPPKTYEPIAVVSSDSNGSFRVGAQAKVNAAMQRAKKDAAKLGANGLLLQNVGNTGGVMVGNAMTTGPNTMMYGVSGGGLIKTVSVVAIHVSEE